MIFRKLIGIVFSFALLIPMVAKAQMDTAKIDLGYNSVDKNLMQGITIHAKDLERLPFSSLDEAINIYFGGVYTIPQNISYVVDGNPAPVISYLSIYDIESITLVQNAQFLLNGALPSQQLIVLKQKEKHLWKKASAGKNNQGSMQQSVII